MSALALGGASGAVAASAHAGCARFRGTDPMVTGQSRYKIAKSLSVPTMEGSIPEARWIRALTFEALIRQDEYATRIATTAVGGVGLPRPTAVTVVDAKESISSTRGLIASARDLAVEDGRATIILKPAVPYPGFAADGATPVLPDFVVVARKESDEDDAWVIVGDAKDYERARSRIDDGRMLKGFIQVAFGAEAFARWGDLPEGVAIHSWGVLVVPRSAFLHPMAVVENLADHRTEVQMRLDERVAEQDNHVWSGNAEEFVSHLRATFDPISCTTCPLYAYCRNELRASTDPDDFLAEIGIAPHLRSALRSLVDGSGTPGEAVSPSVRDHVKATLTGVAQRTGQKRVDPAGQPGTVNIVLAKSDGGSLGVHGMGVQVVTEAGVSKWRYETYDNPNAEPTRRAIMRLLGSALVDAMDWSPKSTDDTRRPVHLIVPDAATADILVSVADSLAGVELSRMRWERDVERGREPLTFDGNPAAMPLPIPLAQDERLAVSFLLEEDRARAFLLRHPIVDLRAAIREILTCGGPSVFFGQLGYLVAWANTSETSPLDARQFVNDVESKSQSSGARLTWDTSNDLTYALFGHDNKAPNLDRYRELVRAELEHKAALVTSCLPFLDTVPDSALRPMFRAVEADAQDVWRRRLDLQAFDLVRFGSTSRYWRNSLVQVIQDDDKCNSQLRALTNSSWALERARDAGVQEIATAKVVALDPFVLEVASRRLLAGSRVVLLHQNDEACVEQPGIATHLLKGSIRIRGLAAGDLSSLEDPNAPAKQVVWSPSSNVSLSVGDELVIANFDWFTKNKGTSQLNVNRPSMDAQLAPKPDCEPESFAESPSEHQYCCQPHVVREAATSDYFAERRAHGEMNPEAWPPIRDADAFDVNANGEPNAETVTPDVAPVPEDATLDELD